MPNSKNVKGQRYQYNTAAKGTQTLSKRGRREKSKLFSRWRIAALLQTGIREEVSAMSSLICNFLVTVGANVVSYYICKWLDSYRKGK